MSGLETDAAHNEHKWPQQDDWHQATVLVLQRNSENICTVSCKQQNECIQLVLIQFHTQCKLIDTNNNELDATDDTQ